MATLFIALLIAGYCGYIIYRGIKRRKNGGGCSCCSGSCAGCSSCGQDFYEKKDREHRKQK